MMTIFSSPFLSSFRLLLPRLLSAGLALLVLAWPTLAMALPTGANVVSGNVTFNQSGNTLDITSTTEHAIVEYTTFGVGLGQTVNFNLPSATASILNRVVGALGIVLPSTIAGTINSNQGSVMLVNTSGVNFTGASQMNVATFIASTLDINDADYLADNLNFDRGALLPAAVSMGGDINAVAGSYIGLFGAHVEVGGNINASGSQVALAVGDEITVDLANGFAATVTVDDPLLTLVGGLVDAIHLNGGTITADNLEIVADIESLLYQRTVNLDGLINVTPADVAQGIVRVVGKSALNDTNIRHTGTINAHRVSLTANDLWLPGDINVGATGTVELHPSNNQPILLAALADDGDGDTFDLTAGVLGNWTLGNLVLGSTGLNADINLDADWTTSYGLTLNTAANVNANGHTLNTSNANLDITAAGTITLGPLLCGTGDVSFASPLPIIIANPWAANNLTLTTTDLTIAPTGSITTLASTYLKPWDNRNITLNGNAVGHFNVDASDLARIHGNRLHIGDATKSGNIFLGAALGLGLGNGFDLDVITGGSIDTSAHALGLGSLDVALTAGTGLNLGAINGNADSLLDVTSSGTVALTGAINAGPLSITAADVDIQQNVNLGAGRFTLRPHDNQDVFLGGNGVGLSLNASELAKISTSGGLALGRKDKTGKLSVNGDVDLTLGGGLDVSLLAGGNIDILNAITLGDNTLSCDTPGALTLGNTITGGAGTVDFISGGNQSINGAIGLSGAGVSTLTTNNGGDITLNASIGGGATTTVDSDGDVVQTAGTVSGTAVNLTTDTGNIGSVGNAVQVAGNTVTLTTTTLGNATVTSTVNNAVVTGAVSGSVAVNAENSVTLTTITANDGAGNGAITVTGTANNAGIALAGNVTAQEGITLTTDGSGDITQSASTLTGDTIVLAAAGGNVGSVGAAVTTQTDTLTINANTSTGTGVVENIGSVDLVGSSAGHTISVEASDDVSVSGSVAATNVSLATTNNNGDVTVGTTVAASNALTLAADGSGDIIQTTGVLGGVGGNTSISLSSGTGNIGTGANAIETNTDELTVSTGGTVNVDETDAVTVHASNGGTALTITAGDTITTDGVLAGDDIDVETTGNNGNVALGANVVATGDVSLITHGSGDISQTVGTLTGDDLVATSTSGDITLSTTVDTAAVNTTGDVTLDESNDVIVLTSTAGDTFAITANGDVTLANGHNVTLNNGDVTVISNDIHVLGTVDSGANGTVTLAPVNANAVIVGAGADDGLTTTFDVDTTELANLTTGHLIIGDAAGTGDLTVTGNWATNHNVTLQTGTNLDASAATLATGNNSLTLTAGNDLTTGTITGGTAALTTNSTHYENTGAINFTQGTIVVNTDTVDLAGGTITAGPAGSITIAPSTPTTTIGLGNPVDGYIHGGGGFPVPAIVGEVPGTLNLTQAEVATLDGGTITFGNTINSGDVYLGALDTTGSNANVVLRTTGSIIDITPTVDTTPNISVAPGASVSITGGAGTGAGQVGSAGNGDIDIVVTGGGSVNVTVQGGGSGFVNQPISTDETTDTTSTATIRNTRAGEDYAYVLFNNQNKARAQSKNAENTDATLSTPLDPDALNQEDIQLTLSAEADEISLCDCEFRRDEKTGTLQAIEKHTKALVAMFKTGKVVSEIVTSGDCQKLYIADYDNNVVYRINPRTKTISKTIAVGAGPVSMHYHSPSNQLFVANKNDRTLSVIETQRDIVVETRALPFTPSKFKATPWQAALSLQGYLPSGKAVAVSLL